MIYFPMKYFYCWEEKWDTDVVLDIANQITDNLWDFMGWFGHETICCKSLDNQTKVWDAILLFCCHIFQLVWPFMLANLPHCEVKGTSYDIIRGWSKHY